MSENVENLILERRAVNLDHLNPPPLGEVAARRAEPAPARAGGGGVSPEEAPSPGLRRGRLSLRETPPPQGEDFSSHIWHDTLHLKRFQAGQDRIEREVKEIKARIANLEGGQASVIRHLGNLAAADAAQQLGLDRLNDRVEHIERRLEISG